MCEAYEKKLGDAKIIMDTYRSVADEACSLVMEVHAENKRLMAENAKYKIVIYVIEQMFDCKFDI